MTAKLSEASERLRWPKQTPEIYVLRTTANGACKRSTDERDLRHRGANLGWQAFLCPGGKPVFE